MFIDAYLSGEGKLSTLKLRFFFFFFLQGVDGIFTKEKDAFIFAVTGDDRTLIVIEFLGTTVFDMGEMSPTTGNYTWNPWGDRIFCCQDSRAIWDT
jgi:hypothetical protein